MKSRNHHHLISALALTLFAGCVDDPDSEQFDVDTEEDSVVIVRPCTDAAADAVFSPSQFFHMVTPTIYSNPNCTKHFVVRSRVPLPKVNNPRFEVGFADPWERTKAQCTGMLLQLKVIRGDGDRPYFPLGTIKVPPQWHAEYGCLLPTIVFNTSTGGWQAWANVDGLNFLLDSGSLPAQVEASMFKFAATAQTAGGTTQPMSITFVP